MYSYEDRIRAVKLYIKLDKCITDLSGGVKRSLDNKQTTHLPNKKLLLIMPSPSFFYL